MLVAIRGSENSGRECLSEACEWNRGVLDNQILRRQKVHPDTSKRTSSAWFLSSTQNHLAKLLRELLQNMSMPKFGSDCQGCSVFCNELAFIFFQKIKLSLVGLDPFFVVGQFGLQSG